MESNKNTKFLSDSRGIFLDPNYGNENVQVENLSIEVDLSVYDRKRSLIKVETDSQTQKERKVVAVMRGGTTSFNQGQKFGDKYAFTTSYTEVSNIEYDGKETLGITNVEIEFNSSYMPMITLELTDVRGKLFQKNNESPYGAFFNFPYPMFELRVKGYFGKPVTYLLHLTKFNTKLESGSGNFKINCNFIGYTYAYLSDMLLGYLKAIPHTVVGQKLLKTRGSNFITFEQLYEYSKRLQEKISKLRDGDEVLALIRAYEVLNIYQGVLNSIDDVLVQIDNTNYDVKNSDNKFLFIRPENSGQLRPIYQLMEQLKGDVDFANQTTITGSKFDFDLSLFELKEGENYFSGLLRKDFVDESNNILSSYGGGYYKFNEEDFRYIATKVQGATHVTENGFIIVYFKKLVDHIYKQAETLNGDVKLKQKNFALGNIDDLTNVVIQDTQGNDINFDFNLFNYTKILCDHVDLLMEAIEDVAFTAEDDDIRNRELKKNAEKLYDIREVDDLDKIYAYPDYKTRPGTNSTNVFTDTWIGREHPNIPEAVFVRDLYEGFLDAKEIDQKWEEELKNEGNTQWFGINPFDSALYTDNRNIWESVKGRKGNEGNIIRLMVLRALVFLNVTVRKPSPKEIKAMAKMEANNLFNVIENDITKSTISMIGNSIENDDIVRTIRQEIEVGHPNHENEFSPINKNAIVAPEFKFTEALSLGWKLGLNPAAPLTPLVLRRGGTLMEDYIYIGGHETASTIDEMIGLVNDEGKIPGLRTYLPLYFSGNTDEFKGNRIISKGDGKLTTNEDRIKLREEGNIFFSDYLGPVSIDNNKPDDGGTYIDFKTQEEYDKAVSHPSYGAKVIEATEINNAKIFSKDELIGLGKNGGALTNVLFNGKWNNLEFFTYTDGGETYPFHNYFYKDEKVTTTTPELQLLFRGDNELNLNTNYHLFGTNFYYQQKRHGRALLFLSVLPFRRDRADLFSKDILPLFSHKASTLRVPKSWVLYIGGLLYRMALPENVDDIWQEKINNINVMPTMSSSVPPKNKVPRTIHNYEDLREPHYTEFSNSYNDFDKVIESLPQSVKDKFIKEFTTWVDAEDGFKLIQNYLEIFENEKNMVAPQTRDVVNLWITNSEDIPLDTNIPSLKKNIKETYKKLGVLEHRASVLRVIKRDIENGRPINSVIVDTLNHIGNVFNFIPTFDEDSIGYQHLMNFLDTSMVLVNGTWRIWVNDESSFPWSGNTATLEGSSHPFTASYENLNNYLTEFIREFKDLKRQEDLAETSIRADVFNSTNLDEVYLTIYKNIKSIYDKWITGRDKQMVTYRNLIENFVFIDRGYNNIGSEFKLNPEHITALLTSSYNNSFYSHFSKILSNNNFDFIPLPNFVDLTSPSEMENLFKPYSYNAQATSAKSAFVCMYVGEKSNRLEGNEDFPDDSLNVLEGEGLPEDFHQVPGILVNYGDENQSIFTSIELDQTEFSETNESILVTDQIANSYNSINTVGQNLFNVFNNRAYNATVGMMGNAMMQPFMYFQLNNIPMFRGAYMIVSVNHSISPNHMTSSIKGNRVKRVKTQLIDKEAIFYNLLGSFGDIRAGEGNLDDLNKTTGGTTSGSGSINVVDYDEDPYNYTFTRTVGKNYNFHIPSNTKKMRDGVMVPMSYEEIFTEVSKITDVPVLTLKTLSVVESQIGQYQGKFFKENYMNELGYVGLMQFHKDATVSVEAKINKTLSNDINFDDYDFHGVVSGSKTIIKPVSWTKNPTENNPQNNSMFDDYISTLAAAYYSKIVDAEVKCGSHHITNMYLGHQQGPTGIKHIIANPNNKFTNNKNAHPPGYDRNMNNNLPKTYDHQKSEYSYQEWYLAWAGHVEAIASDIDDNFNLIVGNDDDNIKLSPSFRLSQFKSKDGAKTPPTAIPVLKELAENLEVIKATVMSKYPNSVMKINSGYRSPSHNASESSTGTTGPHTKAYAADIAFTGVDSREVIRIVLKLIDEGKISEGGIGHYKSGKGRMMHYDIRGTDARWGSFWEGRSRSYDPNIDIV